MYLTGSIDGTNEGLNLAWANERYELTLEESSESIRIPYKTDVARHDVGDSFRFLHDGNEICQGFPILGCSNSRNINSRGLNAYVSSRLSVLFHEA